MWNLHYSIFYMKTNVLENVSEKVLFSLRMKEKLNQFIAFWVSVIAFWWLEATKTRQKIIFARRASVYIWKPFCHGVSAFV